MAWTKIGFYLTFLLLYITVPVGLMRVGDALIEKGIVLDTDSIQFIKDYSLNVETQNLTFATSVDSEDVKDKKIIGSDEETADDILNNFMAPLNFIRTKFAEVASYVKLIYNAPTFFVVGFGLPLDSWKEYVNFFVLLAFLAVLILLIREIK